MKSLKYAIPSFITCAAILAGCISIIYTTLDNVTIAAYLILLAAILDFFDGFFARMLNVISPFGKQMDSLADVINFGLAPSMIMYRLIYRSLVEMAPTSQFNIDAPGFAYNVILNCSFLITIFAAIRLAKFNIDESQAKSFKGLPTPATALFVCSLGITAEHYLNIPAYYLTYNIWFLLAVIFSLSVLMVVNIPIFSLKFENYGIKGNLLRYIFLLLSVIILITLKVPGLALIIILYVIVSVGKSVFS